MIAGLPEKIKKLRVKNGFSQREVAKYLDVSPSIISGYETGERTPSVEMLLSLSNLYQCSTDYLLGREDTGLSAGLNVDGLSDDQILALAELVRTIKR